MLLKYLIVLVRYTRTSRCLWNSWSQSRIRKSFIYYKSDIWDEELHSEVGHRPRRALNKWHPSSPLRPCWISSTHFGGGGGFLAPYRSCSSTETARYCAPGKLRYMVYKIVQDFFKYSKHGNQEKSRFCVSWRLCSRRPSSWSGAVVLKPFLHNSPPFTKQTRLWDLPPTPIHSVVLLS